MRHIILTNKLKEALGKTPKGPFLSSPKYPDTKTFKG